MDRMSMLPMSIGKPPADADWKRSIDKATRSLLELYQATEPLKGATAFRAAVIGDIRLALDNEVSSQSFYVERQGKPHVALSEGFRLLLGMDGFDWKNATSAESVMLVAQRALDEELAAPSDRNSINPKTGKPWTWALRLRYLVGVDVACSRKFSPNKSVEAIRAIVLEHFDTALGSKPTHEMVSTMEVVKSDGSGSEQQETAQVPAMMRMMLAKEDINWYEPANKLRAVEVINEALDEYLAAA